MPKTDYFIRRFRDGILTERELIEKEGIKLLGLVDRARYYDFETARNKLNKLSDVVFEIDHANTVYEHGIKAVHPDNLQILTKEDNQLFGAVSHNRMTAKEQWKYLVSKMGIPWMSDEYSLLYYNFSRLFCAYESFNHSKITNAAQIDELYYPKRIAEDAKSKLYDLLMAKSNDYNKKQKTAILCAMNALESALHIFPEEVRQTRESIISGICLYDLSISMSAFLIEAPILTRCGFSDFDFDKLRDVTILILLHVYPNIEHEEVVESLDTSIEYELGCLEI